MDNCSLFQCNMLKLYNKKGILDTVNVLKPRGEWMLLKCYLLRLFLGNDTDTSITFSQYEYIKQEWIWQFKRLFIYLIKINVSLRMICRVRKKILGNAFLKKKSVVKIYSGPAVLSTDVSILNKNHSKLHPVYWTIPTCIHLNVVFFKDIMMTIHRWTLVIFF